MSDQPRQMTEEEAAEFAEQVFDVARKGDAAMLAALLSKGLPANLRNHKGDTLLMLASYHGHADAVRVLLEYQADPEIRNANGQSPIAGAAFKGDLAMVKLLIEGGAQVEGASADGRTALMMAAMFNRTAIPIRMPRMPMASRHWRRPRPWGRRTPLRSCSSSRPDAPGPRRRAGLAPARRLHLRYPSRPEQPQVAGSP